MQVHYYHAVSQLHGIFIIRKFVGIYFVLTVSNLSQHLKESLLKGKGEDVNAVETDRKQGYGPIHYIVTGKHKFKRELLLVLFVHGKAELDLTTTQHGMTALRLAVEVR